MTANVILIDHDLLVRSTLEDTLIDAGYAVVAFADARDAVRQFPQMNVDLAVTDVRADDTDCVGLIRELRRQHPDLKILAISGIRSSGCSKALADASDVGADRMLLKPFSPHEFVDAIRSLERGE
jgi:DNA-binding response OmpR family regulator